jgi:FkbM family methyltransferase
LEQLDQLIVDAVPLRRGFFIELGAFDGVTQSNSVLLERLGWQGLLIEANPGAYAKCVKARPNAHVVHAACVGNDFTKSMTTITDVGLMSMTSQTDLEPEEREKWLERGEGFVGRPRQDVEVPAETLSSILERKDIAEVDLLILDVEGAEVEVLKGLDFERHAPAWIVAEDAYNEGVGRYLAARGYRREKVLLERKYTRDCLYHRPR